MHPVSIDGDGTWHQPQACRFLKLNHHLYSSFEKSIIERTRQQYIKDIIMYVLMSISIEGKEMQNKICINWLNLFVVFITKN